MKDFTYTIKQYKPIKMFPSDYEYCVKRKFKFFEYKKIGEDGGYYLISLIPRTGDKIAFEPDQLEAFLFDIANRISGDSAFSIWIEGSDFDGYGYCVISQRVYTIDENNGINDNPLLSIDPLDMIYLYRVYKHLRKDPRIVLEFLEGLEKHNGG